MKKIIALILCAVTCFTILCACKGTGKALTVNGRSVDQAEYAFYLNFNRLSIFSDKDDYTKDDLKAAKEEAVRQITANEVVRGKCAELGLKPTAEQKKELKEEKKALVASLGGNAAYLEYLSDSCLTDRGYEKLNENEVYYGLLQEYIDKESETVYTDEMLRKFFAENYICVKYIRLSFVNEDGSRKGDKETAAIYQLAQEVMTKARSGEVAFDTLIRQYSDDTEVLGGSEGVIISILDAKQQPYLEGAFAIKDNEVSEVITDSDGFYIVHRLSVSAEYYEENRSYIHQTAIDFRFAQLIEQWISEAKVKQEKVLKKITFDNLKKYVK